MGNGPGSTSASGAGAGNATGKGGLLGLTIQGGTLKHDSGNNGSKGSANGSESSRESISRWSVSLLKRLMA